MSTAIQGPVFTDFLEELTDELNEQRVAKEPADLRPPFGVPPLGLNKRRLTR
jgi:hypothetical protein